MIDNGIAVPCAWIVLERVHERNVICETACVIHNPTDHHMRYWRLHWRGDRGLFERICPHGVGHPDPDQYPYWRSVGQEVQGVHGCDGCCAGNLDVSDSEDAE